jgi:hypothetical protein
LLKTSSCVIDGNHPTYHSLISISQPVMFVAVTILPGVSCLFTLFSLYKHENSFIHSTCNTSVFSIGTKKKNWVRLEVSFLWVCPVRVQLFCTCFLTARLHFSFLQRKCLLSIEFQEASLNKTVWTESTKYWSTLYSTKFFLLLVHLIVKIFFLVECCANFYTYSADQRNFVKTALFVIYMLF